MRREILDTLPTKSLITINEIKMTGDCTSLHLRDVFQHVNREICFLQFECCGTVNATDWVNLNISGIPMSCCDDTVGAIGTSNCTMTSPNLHHDGCMHAFASFAEKHAAKIAGVGIGLAIIQVSSSEYLLRFFERFLVAFLKCSINQRYLPKVFHLYKNEKIHIHVAAGRNLFVSLLSQINQELLPDHVECHTNIKHTGSGVTFLDDSQAGFPFRIRGCVHLIIDLMIDLIVQTHYLSLQ